MVEKGRPTCWKNKFGKLFDQRDQKKMKKFERIFGMRVYYHEDSDKRLF